MPRFTKATVPKETGKEYVIGDGDLRSNDTERASSSLTYEKLKEMHIDTMTTTPQTIRTYFGMKIHVLGAIAYGTVYKNGVAVGTQRENNTQEWLYFSEDLSFAEGDYYQVYGKTTYEAYTCDIRDQRIRGSTPPYISWADKTGFRVDIATEVSHTYAFSDSSVLACTNTAGY